MVRSPTVCLHVMSPSPRSSKSPSKFNIVSMVTDISMGHWIRHPFCSSKCLLKKIKCAAHKNGDVDGTCKRSLTCDICSVTDLFLFGENECEIELIICTFSSKFPKYVTEKKN